MIYFYQKQNWYSLLNDGKAPSVSTYEYMFWPKYKSIAILKHDYTNNRYSVNQSKYSMCGIIMTSQETLINYRKN